MSGVSVQVSGLSTCGPPTPHMKLQLKANRRTAEYRMSNVEVWNRFALSFLINNDDRIPYFDIRYSLFQSFFFDLTGRFFSQRRRSYETTKVDGLINNVVAGFIPARKGLNVENRCRRRIQYDSLLACIAISATKACSVFLK